MELEYNFARVPCLLNSWAVCFLFDGPLLFQAQKLRSIFEILF